MLMTAVCCGWRSCRILLFGLILLVSSCLATSASTAAPKPNNVLPTAAVAAAPICYCVSHSQSVSLSRSLSLPLAVSMLP